MKIGDLIKHKNGATVKVIKIINEAGDHLEKANPGNMVHLITNPPSQGWETGALLRKEV